MEGIKKIKSLLKFYKKNNVDIQLKFDSPGETKVHGIITDNDLFFKKYIVLESVDFSPIKIFLEDIYNGSIMPYDLIVKSEQKNKNKNTSQPVFDCNRGKEDEI